MKSFPDIELKLGQILIISFDPYTTSYCHDLYESNERDDAWQNLNSARATHHHIIYCTDFNLYQEHKELLNKEVNQT
jgi:hypothetical protein